MPADYFAVLFVWLISAAINSFARRIHGKRIHASTLTAMTYAKSLMMTYENFIEVLHWEVVLELK